MDDGELLFVPINPPIQSEFLEIDSENDFNNTEIKIEEKINTCFKYFNEAIKYQHKLEYDGAISLYSKILNSKDLFDLKKEIKRFAEKTVFAIKNNYETNEEQSSENEIETDSEENDFYIEFDQNEILGVYKLLNLANKGLGQSYLATLSMIHKIIAEKLYTPSERDNGCITITKEMIEMNVRPYKIVKIPMWLELQKIIEHVNEENTTIFCFKKESSIKEQTQEPRNRDAMDIDQTMNKLNLDIIINDAFNSFESSLLYDQNDTESWYSAGCCALSLEKFPESINMFLGGLTSSLYSFGRYNTRTRYNDGSACIYLNNRKSILFGNIIQAIKNLLTKTDSSLSESNNQNVTISQIHQIIREALDRERIRKHSDIELVRTCSGLSPLGWRCLEGLFYAYLMQGNYETMHKVAVLGRSVNRVFMAEEETILEANLNLNINIKEYLDKLSWKAGSESEFLHYEKKEILEIPNITDNVFHESESNTSLDYIENNKTAFFKNIILKSYAKNKNMGFIESYISLNSENIINELGNKLINYIDVLHENPKEGKAKDIFKLLTSKINIKLDYNSLMDIDTVKNKSKKTKFLNEKPIDVIDVDNDPILPNKSFNYPSNGKTNQKNSGTVSMSRNNNFIGTINNNSAPNFNQSNISHNRDALNSNSRALGKSASDVGEKRAEVIVTHVLNQNPATGLNTLTKHIHGSKRKSESSDSEQKQFKRRTSSRVRRIAKTNDTIDVQSKSENNTNLGSDSDSFDFTRLGIPKFPTRSSLEIFEDLFTNKNVGINNEHKNNLDNHSANKTSEKDSAQFLQRNNALSLHEAGTDSNEITTNVDSLSHTEIHKTKPPINQSIKINKESSNLSPENVKLAKHLEKASKSLDMLKIEYFHETPNEKNSLPDNIFTAESGRVIWELASKLYKSKNVEPFTRNKKLFQTPKKNKNDETDGNVSHFTRYYLDDLAKERKSEKRFSKLKSKSSKADDKKLEQKFVNEISESNEGVYDVMIKLLFFLVDNPNNNEDGGSHPDSTSTSQQILEQDFGTGKFSQFNQSALNLICCGGGVLVDILEQKIHQYAIEFVSPDLSDYSSNCKINQNQNKYSYKVDYLLDIVVLSLFITEKLSFQIENLIQRLMYMPSKNVIMIDIEQEHPVSESSNLSPENVKLAKHLEKASKSLDMLKIEYFHETPNEKNSLPDNIFTAESGRVIWELASKLYKSKNVEPFTRNKKLFQTPKKNKNDETDGNVSHFTRYYLDDLAKERKSEKRFSKLKSKSSKADDKKLEQKFVNEISESNEGVYDVMIKLLFFLVDNPNNNEDGGSHPDSTSTSQQILEQDFGTGKFSQFNQSALNLICCGGGVLVDILEQKIHQYAIEFVSPDLSDYSSNCKINQNQNKYSYKVDYLLDIVVLSLFITEKLSFQIENLIQRLMYMPSKNVIMIDIEQEHPVSVIEEEKEKISQKLIELNELFDSWYSLYDKLRTQIRTVIVVPELKSKSDYLRHLKTFLEFAEISYCWNKTDNDPSIFVLYSKDSSLSSRFSKMYNTSNLLSKFAFSKNETSTNNKVDQEFVNISKLHEFVDERIDHCEWLGQVDIAQNSIAQNDSYKTIQILESILIQKIVMPLKSCLYGSGKLPKKTSSGVFIVASEILDTLAESYYQTLNTKSTFIILLLKLSILVDQFSNLFKKSYIIDKQEQSKGTMKLFLEISKLLELVHCLPKSPDSLQTGNNELEINYLFEDENVSPLKPLSIYLGYPLVHHKADDSQKAEFSKIVTDYIYYHLGTNLSKLALIMASCMPVYEKNNIHKFTQSTKTSANSSYTKLTNQNKDSNKISSEETSEQSGLSPTDNRHDGIISNLVNVIDNHLLKIPFFKEDIKNCYNWEILLSESIPKDWIKTITLGIRLSAVILERTIGINNQESLSSFTNYLESVHSLMGIFGLCTYKTCASSSNYFKTPAGLSFSTRFETARRGFCDYSLSSSRRIALACLDELETEENQIGDANTENHNSSLTSLEETPRKDQQETESNLKYNVCNSQIGNNNVLDNDSNKRPRSKSSEAISLIEHTLGVFSQAVFCLYDVTIDLEYNGWWIPDNHIRSIGIISHFIESYYLANKELGENSEFLQTLDGEEIDGK
ncbi:hypothetical protein BB558_001964, partial [Smittium angustum]